MGLFGRLTVLKALCVRMSCNSKECLSVYVQFTETLSSGTKVIFLLILKC